jgi:serine/threonine protein kinase
MRRKYKAIGPYSTIFLRLWTNGTTSRSSDSGTLNFVGVAQQLCAGVAATHRNGVLHRDLKPSNVMIDGMGRARITDFGLAIAATEAS